MTSIGSPSPFFLAGKKAYAVERSLRFDDDQSSPTRLTRTVQSGGNLKKFTISFWVKRSQLGNSNYSNSSGNSGQQIIHTVGAGNRGVIKFTSADKIQFTQGSDSGGSAGNISTNAVFRDVSAWYHICVVADYANSTTADRAKIFVNGVRQDVTTTTNFADANGKLNTNQIHELGFAEYGSGYTGSSWWYNFFCGYMAEFYFIDGQAYDPSYFTETNVTTGQLVPKEYTGSFGTTGWYLNFSDNSGTTATTLGKDSSGNSNNWTPNGFSVSAGAGNDSVPDSPTNNFCTFNGLKVNASNPIVFSNGALQHNGVSGDNHLRSSSTMQVNSGKWYVEFKFISGYEATNSTVSFGLTTDAANNRQSNVDAFWYQNTDDFVAIAYRNNGALQVFLEASSQSTLSGMPTFVNGDVMGLAVDLDNDKLFVSKNGTFFSNGTGTQDPAAGSNPVYSGGFLTSRKADGFYFSVDGYSAQVVTADFGQHGYAYTPPTGFKAVNSENLPDPTINFPDKHFDTVLYTGDGNATGSQTNVLEFQPDWLWTKPRNAAYVHLFYDSVRGAGSLKALNLGGGTSPGTGGEGAAVDNSVYGFLNSFDANGFSYTKGSFSTTYFNQSGINYVVWNWNAGDTDSKTYVVKVHNFSGNNRYIFDDFQTEAVTLTLAEGGTYIFNMDDASNASHPFMIGTTANDNTTAFGSGIVYKLDGVVKTFAEYHAGFYSATTRRLEFTIPASTNNLFYFCYSHSGMGGQVITNSTLGSSNFDGSIQSVAKVNASAGFSIVLYTGNGTAGATIGHGLGVTPQTFIVKKRSDSGTNWRVYHHRLNGGSSPEDYNLILNQSSVELDRDDFNDTAPTSTSFTLGTHTSTNNNGHTYVAYCFSEVAGYSKFGSYTGNGSTNGTFVFTGFRPAVIILKRTNTAASWVIHDDKRAGYNGDNDYLHPDLVQAESDGSTGTLDILSNGFKLRMTAGTHNGSGDTFIYLAFAESPFKYARAR